MTSDPRCNPSIVRTWNLEHGGLHWVDTQTAKAVLPSTSVTAHDLDLGTWSPARKGV